MRLPPCAMRVVAAPAFADEHPLDGPCDLAGIATLAYASWQEPARWTLRARQPPHTRQTVRIVPLHLSTNIMSLRDAALEGLGAANLPAWLVDEDISKGKLVELLPAWRAPDQSMHAVLPPGRLTPRRTRVFIAMLRDALTVSEPCS